MPEFITEFEAWEKSPLMCCEQCMESDLDQTIRDCPCCGEALCFDCAEDHPKDGDCDDDDCDEDEDFDEDEDEDEEDDDLTDDDEDDSEEWE